MSSRLKDDSTMDNLDLEGYEAAISFVTQISPDNFCVNTLGMKQTLERP